MIRIDELMPDGAARFEALVRRPGPALGVVAGPDGSGRRALLAAAAAAGRLRHTDEAAAEASRNAAPGQALWFEVLAAPESLQASAFADLLRTRLAIAPTGTDLTIRDWAGAFGLLRDHLDARRTPILLVLDGVDNWTPGGAGAAFGRFWAAIRAQGLPLNLIVVGDGTASLPELDAAETVIATRVPVSGLRRVLAAWTPRDRFLLWAALGGHVDRLLAVDAHASLASNLKRLLLTPTSSLHRAPVAEIAARLQKPERYLGIVAALAGGARDWTALRAAIPELEDGSRLAPYLSTLEALGWVDSEASLDARPGARRRRYSLRDPYTGFWFAGVAPILGQCRIESPGELWSRHLRGALEAWGGRMLGRACAQALLTIGDQHLRTRARQVGALWGEGYDLPVAGTLFSGAAVVGTCTWGRAANEADADALDAQLRRTRFGFGRENRMRVVFSDGDPDDALLRRAARDDLLEVIRLDELF